MMKESGWDELERQSSMFRRMISMVDSANGGLASKEPREGKRSNDLPQDPNKQSMSGNKEQNCGKKQLSGEA